MTFNSFELKKLRSEKKLSIRELAELSGVAKSQISDLENGQLQNTTIDTLCKIATALEIEASKLFSC